MMSLEQDIAQLKRQAGLYPRPYMARLPNATSIAVYVAAGLVGQHLRPRAQRR